MMKKQLSKIILIILGILILSLFIWLRFIRERLPRDIPFDLSITTWIIIMVICLALAFNIIISLIKVNLSYAPNIRYKITQKFKIFVKFLVDNKYSKPYFSKYIISCESFIQHRSKHVYFLMEQIPLIILIITLLIDIFYFHKVHYFYKIIWIGLLPLIIMFLLYIFKGLFAQTTETIDSKAELYCVNLPVVETIMLSSGVISNIIPMLPADELALLRAARISNKGTLIEYFPSFRLDWLAKERIRLNLPDTFKLNTKTFNIEMRGAVNLATSICITINRYEKEKKKYKYIRLIISTLYLISWLYILFTGNISPDLITFLEVFQDITEPFSTTIL